MSGWTFAELIEMQRQVERVRRGVSHPNWVPGQSQCRLCLRPLHDMAGDTCRLHGGSEITLDNK